MTDVSTPAPYFDAGDFAPLFKAPVLDGRPDWAFGSVGGVAVMLFFLGSTAHPQISKALAAVLAQRAVFDDRRACFFGVTCDPTDAAEGRIAQDVPGVRHFLDYDRGVSSMFGAVGPGKDQYRPHILVLDRTLQVVGRFEIDQAKDAVAALSAVTNGPYQDWAPVLTVPNVLESRLCGALIDLYDRKGGTASGFMREVDGRTTVIADDSFKRRADAQIDDPVLRQALVQRINRRLVPAIQRTFQFEATRIERYIVAAYDTDLGGYFRPHRDNTTKGTAHRRFAVTINLNDNYEGGDLRFPEFGPRTYRAPKGGAVVFSCSLLHEATPMIAGRRYATLPFLYDEAAAAVRAENNRYLDPSIGSYHHAAVVG